MSDHAIVHIEFSANDPSAAGQFYSELFGWKAMSHPEMNYTTFSADPGPGGGFSKVDGTNVHAGSVLVYISTDDIDATLARIEAAGGKTAVPKTPIPGMGSFAVFTDPTGNHVGLYSE